MSVRTFFLLAFLLLPCGLLLMHSHQPIFAHGGSDYASDDMLPVQMKSCIMLEEHRGVCYASLCDADLARYLCAEHVIEAATAVGGPEVGMAVLREILESSIFGISSNGHSLAHIVGQSASRYHGTSGDVFNRCPTDFDYGCLHGFFEEAMLSVDSPVEALVQICEESPSKVSFDKVNCYHGGGHGIMMNESYNLERALAVCDSLPDSRARFDCYGGVFMENTNGFKEGRIEHEFNTFRSDNPLAPCDSVDDAYGHECWILHADYLISAYSTSLDDLIDVCLGAGDYVETCLIGVARIFSSDRQDMIVRGSNLSTDVDFLDRALFFCNQFPEQYIQACHYFVASHLILPDQLVSGFENSKKYCMLIDFDKKECFRRIGVRLGELVSSNNKIEMCEDDSIPALYRHACSGGLWEEFSEERVGEGWKYTDFLLDLLPFCFSAFFPLFLLAM